MTIYDVRTQPRCYYASAAYSASFWGKYIWIYEGKARLRLTSDAIILERSGFDLTIPLDAVKSIGLGRMSIAAKPFGLERLVVRYSGDGEMEEIHLVPYESPWKPTWETSELVESWFETFGEVDALANRIEPPAFEPVVAPTISKVGGLTIAVAASLLVGMFLWGLLLSL